MPVRVDVSDDAVDVTFSGWDRVWTLRHHVHLAMADVTGARVAPVAPLKRELGLRLGGTAWPGRAVAGNYSVKGRLRSGERELWCVYRDPEALVIDLRTRKPRRVVLQHPGRHDLAWWIGERVHRKPA
jgi:hypothetical protein